MTKYGIIGFPLTNSFSKQYFNNKIDKEAIANAHYENFPLNSIEEFPQLIKANPELKGLSVTIPYKETVLQYINNFSDEVKKIGATNCIRIKNRKLTAFNTDIIGFEKSFIKLLQPVHKKALVLGTGGAS
ncbi:MAG TPA: shikimate dehydrogenase, partial [Ferruginibacter sp.]|nr:shikimate dehydrogenase [Ferruginibacter sp.]